MKQLNEEFLEIFTSLLQIPAPPGREEKMAEAIRKRLTASGYKSETDPAGNIIVRLDCAGHEKPKTIFAAHMDEIGMTVTKIEGNGDLRVCPSGGLHPCKLGERQVVVCTDKDMTISGVFSMGSTHSKAFKDGVWAPDWDSVRIVTGLTPQELKEAGVRPGSSAVPSPEGRGPYIFGSPKSPLISAWSFDDRAGVAILLLLLKELKKKKFESSCPLLVAFTTHEEGGCHGARALAAREKPERFISIDGCPVVDPEVLKLDGRPGIWSKDMFGNYDQRLVRDLMRAASEAGTELQPTVNDCASSDASEARQAGGADRVATMGYVAQNSHGFAVANIGVFSNVFNTLLCFTEKFC